MTIAQIGGPLRVGCFANASSTRVGAGASYYGAMNLTGNLRERIITVGDADGRSYLGTHGDGNLSVQGNHTNADWPTTYAEGTGTKGGDWVTGVHFCGRTSDRFAAASPNYTRSGNIGMRACRTVQ